MVGAEELLRASVKALKGKRTQRSLAKAIGVSDTNMSDFLAGEQGLGLDRLAPLAKVLGISIADLFVVRKSNATPSPELGTTVVPYRAEGRAVESASQTASGNADVAHARLLEEHAQLTKEKGIIYLTPSVFRE